MNSGETMIWGEPVFVRFMIEAIPWPGAAGLLDCREPCVVGSQDSANLWLGRNPRLRQVVLSVEQYLSDR